MSNVDPKSIVEIVYTNYRGETGTRRIVPKMIRFASSEWHPEEQWLLDAYDLERKADRSFALKDIHSWKSVTTPLVDDDVSV